MRINTSVHAFLLPISMTLSGVVVGCDAEPVEDGVLEYAEDPDAEDNEEEEGDETGGDEDSSPAVGPVGSEPDVSAANWNIGWAEVGSTQANVSWDVNYNLPEDYSVCWKNVNQSGSVCKQNRFDVTVTANSPGYSSSTGVMGVMLNNLVCGETYKVRIKRSAVSYDTEEFLMDCGCADPCPQGGWYDGANCYLGSAPSGTTAFIWNDNYYHTAVGTNSCPLAGTYYDGANCFFMDVPSGVNPFIWAGRHWYYSDCP